MSDANLSQVTSPIRGRLLAILAAGLLLEYAFFFTWYVRYAGPRAHLETWNNLLNQGRTAPILYGIIMVAALYGLRLCLGRSGLPTLQVIRLFLLAVAASLPYIWLLVANAWRGDKTTDAHCWFGAPLVVLFVPFASFYVEQRTQSRPSLLRYLLEMVVLCPIWFYLYVSVIFYIILMFAAAAGTGVGGRP